MGTETCSLADWSGSDTNCNEPFKRNTQFTYLVLRILSLNFALLHSDLEAHVLGGRICWRCTV